MARDATGADRLRSGDQQMDDQHQEFAHGAKRIMVVSMRKAAPQGVEFPPTTNPQSTARSTGQVDMNLYIMYS